MSRIIDVDHEVISKRQNRPSFCRSLIVKFRQSTACRSLFGSTAKAAVVGSEAARLVRQLTMQIKKALKSLWGSFTDVLEEIKSDWKEAEAMGFIQAIKGAILGPDVVSEGVRVGGRDFQPPNVSGEMLGAVVSQQGWVTDEQVDYSSEMLTATTENLKRLMHLLKNVEGISKNETEVTNQVYKTISVLDKNNHKIQQYQQAYQQRRRILKEKHINMRVNL